MENDALQHKVILNIYGSNSNEWDANCVVRWSHKCPWQAIGQTSWDFFPFTRYFVRDDTKVSFGKIFGR